MSRDILVGQRFGKLTVLELAQEKDRGHRCWTCKCDCGIIKPVRGQSLRAGLTSSCGCLLFSSSLRPYEYLYNRLGSASTKRNIAVDISYDLFVRFTESKNCHYCHAPIQWYKTATSKKYLGYQLDRKDNKIGYTINNCVVCCKRCNQSKSNTFSYEEWYEMTKPWRDGVLPLRS